MKVLGRFQSVLVASLLVAAPAFAQSSQETHPMQGGNSPATVGSNAQTKQKTQSLTRSDPSTAYKQKTQGDLPEVGPASGAYKGNVPRSQY
jgi:hypothetical protein